MSRAIPRRFADITAKLEDLHAVAVEGQRADNAADMQEVLLIQLRSGIAALDASVRTMAKSLKGARP
jgi:hypothetical protein